MVADIFTQNPQHKKASYGSGKGKAFNISQHLKYPKYHHSTNKKALQLTKTVNKIVSYLKFEMHDYLVDGGDRIYCKKF